MLLNKINEALETIPVKEETYDSELKELEERYESLMKNHKKGFLNDEDLKVRLSMLKHRTLSLNKRYNIIYEEKF